LQKLNYPTPYDKSCMPSSSVGKSLKSQVSSTPDFKESKWQLSNHIIKKWPPIYRFWTLSHSLNFAFPRECEARFFHLSGCQVKMKLGWQEIMFT